MHVVHMTYMTYIHESHESHDIHAYVCMWCTHADNQKDNNNIPSTFSCTHVQIQSNKLCDSKYLQPTLDLFCTSCLKIRRFSFNL